ncbi:MAG: hypothetical protein QOJ09_1013 [Actinomycetota bacterium]|jgi:hypothetical protein|nr:hypothetical protein [Actinomycetota bacterium]
MRVLSAAQRSDFESQGFVLLEEAFPRSVADRCRARLWAMLDEDPDDPSTWRRPVVRIWTHSGPEFTEAATSRRWIDAIHEVAGPEVVPPPWLGGTTPVRFPVEGDPGDDGWHIDGSYEGPDGTYWVNRRSRGRALLMLVLLSDVGDLDAPTRLRVGSHHLVPDALDAFGDTGVSSMTFRPPRTTGSLPIAFATGRAGDVYLCHPFLVHAAQRHRGATPRFVSQPGVPWRDGVEGLAPDPR